MTARTTERDTTEWVSVNAITFPVAAAVSCLKGALACLDSSGRVKPATGTATNVEVVGVFAESQNNTSGGAGALNCNVLGLGRDIRWFTNSTAGDLIAATDVGSDAYAVDDDLVALTSSSQTRKRAGRILGVDAARGVAVLVGAQPRVQTIRVTMVGGTVTVTTGLKMQADSTLSGTRTVAGGTAGHLTATRNSATSLTVSSSSGTDTSTVDVLIFG